LPGGAALLLLWCMLPRAASAATLVHHELQVTLTPDRGHIAVRDQVTLPAALAGETVLFALHAGLKVTLAEPAAHLTPAGEAQGMVPVRRYRVALPPGTRSLTLRYQGRISHPLVERSNDKGPTQRNTAGHIGPDGVYLDAASRWFPSFGDDMLSFRMEVTLPAGWRAVSQGRGEEGAGAEGQQLDRWEEQQPQDDIYLLAGPLQEHRRSTPWGDALVYLRRAEPALAQRYLTATARYLDLYSRLLGPYPYAKFALVENFWETGYGMPSFTLLGPRVLRLPFIVHTSYPHEILHNWWGNGVYVDYATGNWGEGLTSYLADHLLAEERGQGADYRRAALQKYADYVAAEHDFPLAEFRGRHGEVTQAVGYSKSLMLFHMLRLQLGDETFLQGLRRFFQDQRFRRAGFADLQAAFEAVSKTRLDDFLRQWVQRTGAPRLTLESVTVQKSGDTYRIRGTLKQTQDGPAYALHVPVAVQLEGQGEAFQTTVAMSDRRQALDIAVNAPPVHLSVDPQFDLFRRLDRAEIPASLGQLFGAERATFVLPAAAPPALRAGYEKLAQAWARDYADAALVWDSELNQLPSDGATWILGWENRFRDRAALAGQVQSLDEQGTVLKGKRIPRASHSLVLSARRADNPELGLAWLGSDNAAALPGLARKLPHYAKYSYLAFTGAAPDNVLKGQWQVLDSPLSVDLAPPGTPRAPMSLAPRPALTMLIGDGR